MAVERGEVPSPFRAVVRPMVEGTSPYEESIYKDPDTRALNERAVLEETVYLYDGSARSIPLGNRTIEVRSFIDIRTGFFPGGKAVYHPFVYWGLKDAASSEDIEGYADASISVDPIYIFRIAKVLEALPTLSENSPGQIEDYCSAAGAVQQTFYPWELEPGEFRDQLFHQRQRIVELIGRDKLEEILLMIPPDLEQTMHTMRGRSIGVLPDNLEREIRLKRINPSEFYLDMIDSHRQRVDAIAMGLEETGGAW